jgi:phospholipase A-2-activating protein
MSFIYSVQATSGKKLYQGKEYDYVFDIEIDEPRCTLKLPFNIADDPYMAAQQFIHK